jgi:hypothetical protein
MDALGVDAEEVMPASVMEPRPESVTSARSGISGMNIEDGCETVIMGISGPGATKDDADCVKAEPGEIDTTVPPRGPVSPISY